MCSRLLLAGHSLGEYSALVAAGVLAFADAVCLVHKRGAFMQAAVPPGTGSMAAMLGVSRQEVEALCQEFAPPGVLQPANYNAPGQIVIAGDTACVQAAASAVKERRLGRTVAVEGQRAFSLPITPARGRAVGDSLCRRAGGALYSPCSGQY